MRSRGSDLRRVVRQFEGWRARRRERCIPEELLDAAVGLLEEHSASAICRALRLNSSRFKRARDAREGDLRRRGHTGVVRRQGRRALRATLAREGASSGGFVELPPVSSDCGGAVFGPRALGVSGALTGWRLSLESSRGSVSIVMPAPDRGMVDAVRRFLLGTLGA